MKPRNPIPPANPKFNKAPRKFSLIPVYSTIAKTRNIGDESFTKTSPNSYESNSIMHTADPDDLFFYY